MKSLMLPTLHTCAQAFPHVKGIVQPFELGGETRLIRSDVKK
jgi:hypothetical protein